MVTSALPPSKPLDFSAAVPPPLPPNPVMSQVSLILVARDLLSTQPVKPVTITLLVISTSYCALLLGRQRRYSSETISMYPIGPIFIEFERRSELLVFLFF